MFQRALNLLLLAAALLGAVLAWQAGRDRSRAKAEYERLAALVGDLRIEDPTKVHLRAVPTGDPLHFAWRVYLPPNYRQQLRSSTGGSGMSWSSNAVEFVARVRFKQDDKGVWSVYNRFHGGSGLSSLGSGLHRALKDRWDEIHVEQLAADETVLLAPDESATLLRLVLSPELAAEMREKKLLNTQGGDESAIYDLKLGPDQSSL